MTPDSFSELPKRRRPVHLPLWDAAVRSNIVFLTVCTKDRRPVLANPEMMRRLTEAWSAATRWRVGRYVIMPDHVHLFCAPGSWPAESLALWVRYWKRLTAQAVAGDVWQKNFWDTQLRRHESYGAKWEYVRQNPVRAELVKQSEDWPYQGELNVLEWVE